MAGAKRRERAYDGGRVWAALVAQVGQVRAAVAELTDEEWTRPSGLPGWDVRMLVAHLVRQVDVVRVVLAEPAPPAGTAVTGLSTWALSTAGIADELDAGTRETAARTPDVVAALAAAAEGLAAQEQEALRADRIVPHVFGAMRALDFTVTRLVELVVHSDDLARATGRDVPLDKQALAAVVRLLADALAVKAPGNSVEVRVPPYAAVQCVQGPRHTRGTPPNVVETDPLTWIRLATGRTGWASARQDAAVSASGERADLSPYLPVMS
ncbi:maleylpyruvate isomerase family mycothiol-dependent enzyme [Actinacidiphila acididurans]|uniref:Maleylpyruvate isomerase family mycothiol-dependent enzyme n=1 Tax=Actinacidiphila acididurans TaxID=2784346 RepID=A0ABS2U026_9ACTN|nr:maleylpyruvate isomerase family mycothiol-dependent enzyme [Actinacidiphila acididurans]MBM9508952.1 maleylpyruvate isomerase family mycothiol-dependent enzyme [Actinacidiphila acididurans]